MFDQKWIIRTWSSDYTWSMTHSRPPVTVSRSSILSTSSLPCDHVGDWLIQKLNKQIRFKGLVFPLHQKWFCMTASIKQAVHVCLVNVIEVEHLVRNRNFRMCLAPRVPMSKSDHRPKWEIQQQLEAVSVDCIVSRTNVRVKTNQERSEKCEDFMWRGNRFNDTRPSAQLMVLQSVEARIKMQ